MKLSIPISRYISSMFETVSIEFRLISLNIVIFKVDPLTALASLTHALAQDLNASGVQRDDAASRLEADSRELRRIMMGGKLGASLSQEGSPARQAPAESSKAGKSESSGTKSPYEQAIDADKQHVESRGYAPSNLYRVKGAGTVQKMDSAGRWRKITNVVRAAQAIGSAVRKVGSPTGGTIVCFFLKSS
jgi:hypothetical protein